MFCQGRPGTGAREMTTQALESVTFNEQKFRELVLYIAGRCQGMPYYGTTKLYKVLFYSDFQAFKNLGRPITAARYVALEHGPVPEERDIIQSDMTRRGELAVQQWGK